MGAWLYTDIMEGMLKATVISGLCLTAGIFLANDCFNAAVGTEFLGEMVFGGPKKNGESMKPTAGDNEAKAEERACRDAFVTQAIGFLRVIDGCEGVDLPTIPGDLTIPGGEEGLLGNSDSVVDNLPALHDAGRVCTEIVSDAKDKKAWSSLPESSYGDDTQYINHPGINVFPDYLSSGNGCSKDEETGEYTFDDAKVAELAVTLAHEPHHLMNPPEEVAAEREEEGPAWSYEGQVIEKVLCCSEITEPVKVKMCEILEEVRAFLAKHDLPLLNMSKCEEEEALLASSSPYDLSQLRALSVPYRGSFPQGEIYGRSILDPFAKTIEFKFHGFKDIEFTLDFDLVSEPGLADFQPTALSFEPSSPGPTSMIIAGFDLLTLEGMLVRVMFDSDSTPPCACTVLVKSHAFDFPVDIDVPEFTLNRVVVLDKPNSSELKGIQVVSGHVELIGDSSTNPELDSCWYVTAWPEILTGSTASAAVVSTHSETDLIRADVHTRFIDLGPDGTFDDSY